MLKRRMDNEHRVDTLRRAIVMGGAGLLASVALGGCRRQPTGGTRNRGIDGRDYTIAPPTGPAREVTLEARLAEVELGPGLRRAVWTYDGRLPGTEIRVKEGERLRVTVRNTLSQETSVHWHGLPQRGTNNMDGVPGITQAPIAAGASFLYDFRADQSGTYFFHSHSGLQVERGLYAPLIVEPHRETLAYDREYVLVLDDWLDGSPEDELKKLMGGQSPPGSMPGMKMNLGAIQMGQRDMGQMQMEDGADIAFTTFLINGRTPEAAPEFKVKQGERVRLRLINAASGTMFRVACGGHPLTVTHTDGMPLTPVEVDTLEISMGERYDVLLTANNPGVWPLVAVSTDEPARAARAVLRYESVRAAGPPPLDAKPAELQGRLLSYEQLRALAETPAPPVRAPDRNIELALNGSMSPYTWTINGKTYPAAEPFEIRAGELVRVSLVNHSMMRHPMHLHGHTFRLTTGGGTLKDTAVVMPGMGRLGFEFYADNPGDWFFHCHHAYHMEAGMARLFKYV